MHLHVFHMQSALHVAVHVHAFTFSTCCCLSIQIVILLTECSCVTDNFHVIVCDSMCVFVYSESRMVTQAAKLKCILCYFRRVAEDKCNLSSVITLRRQVITM